MYCCYCGQRQGDKFMCCEENHFVPFNELDKDMQQAILEDEGEQDE